MNKLNAREKIVARKYMKKGWSVFHKGLPDFIMVRDNRIMFLEVKGLSDKLSKHQRKLKKLLVQAGYKYEVIRITDSGQTVASLRRLDKLMKLHRW